MSKMSQLHAELTQQAAELGFKSIEEAEANGYHIDYTSKGWKLKLDMAKAYEQAHEAWLKEKACTLEGLEDLRKRIPYGWTETIDVLDRAIKFVKEAHD